MHGYDFSNSNVPAFLVKLWKLVEDPSCNDLISWSERGNTFIIKDQGTFAKKLLPKNFKHNNMASFIRQLNMYGFRKAVNFTKGSMQEEGDEVEFNNPYFLKGQVALLQFIKRKIPNVKGPETPNPGSSHTKSILTDLSSIQEKQESMNTMLNNMKKENEQLWRELSSLRKKHKAQEQIIQRVIQFLVTIVQNGKQNIGLKHQITRMLHGNKGTDSNPSSRSRQLVQGNKADFLIPDNIKSPNGPVIHEVIDGEQEEFQGILSKSKLSTSNAHSLNSSPEPTSNPVASILSPMNSGLSVLSSNHNVEEILGVPFTYASLDEPVPDIASIVSISEDCSNVSSEEEDDDDVIPITKEDICNTISIPENSTNIISLPDISDFIVTDSSNVISLPDSLHNIIPMPASSSSLVQPSTSKVSSGKQMAPIALPSKSFDDTRTNKLAATPPCSDLIPYTTTSMSSFLNSGKTSHFNQGETLRPSVNSSSGKKGKVIANVLPTNLLAGASKQETLAGSSSKDLNVSPSNELTVSLANHHAKHLLQHVHSVDEELENLQKSITLDDTLDEIYPNFLLDLFSTDDMANSVSLANQSASDYSVLKQANANNSGLELNSSPDLDLLNFMLTSDEPEATYENDLLEKNDFYAIDPQSIKRERMSEDDGPSKVAITNSASPPKKKKTINRKLGRGRRKSKTH